MILSDVTIRQYIRRGLIGMTPMPEDHRFQAASIDLTLSDEFVVFTQSARFERVGYTSLEPGDFAICSTLEHIKIPDSIMGIMAGKSSLARMGLIVESAGIFDPGFKGNGVLEVKNIHPFQTIHLTAGMEIAQIYFMQLDRPSDRPYGSEGLRNKYQGQTGPTEAK